MYLHKRAFESAIDMCHHYIRGKSEAALKLTENFIDSEHLKKQFCEQMESTHGAFVE